MEPNATLFTIITREYFSNRPSDDCVRAMREFIDTTPAGSGLDEHLIKRLLKVGAKTSPQDLTVDHLARLHEYAHHVAQDLEGRLGVKRLRAHLHRDAADIVRKQYGITGDVPLAQEALADYHVAAYGVDLHQEPQYALETLTDWLQLTIKVGAYLHEPEMIDSALRELGRFPKKGASNGAVRYATNTIDYARIAVARMRQSALARAQPQRF